MAFPWAASYDAGRDESWFDGDSPWQRWDGNKLAFNASDHARYQMYQIPAFHVPR
jgi:hypothetical protein